jgi:hypothetical protein
MDLGREPDACGSPRRIGHDVADIAEPVAPTYLGSRAAVG